MILTIKHKIATIPYGTQIVCDNSDMVCHIVFDDEWNNFPCRTVRVDMVGSINGFCDVTMNSKCDVVLPRIPSGTRYTRIGVYAEAAGGDAIATTSPAIVPCVQSIFYGNAVEFEAVTGPEIPTYDDINSSDTIRYDDVSEGQRVKTTWTNIVRKIRIALSPVYAEKSHTHTNADITDAPWGFLRNNEPVIMPNCDIDFGEVDMLGVPPPTQNDAAANKCYVDEQIASAIATVDALVGTGVIE